MAKVGIMETAIRDGHQSLLATRMRTEDMIPVLELMDSIGYHSIECWGGATFDTCLRFLKEDPWERLREIKKRLKHTPTQMLLRGQNAVGYRHYADDVIDEFCDRAVQNGMDIFRIFDALNDTRNLETAFRAVKKAGGHVQGAICYTTSPVHTVDSFAKLADEMIAMGADSIAIKDMAGLLSPMMAKQIVERIRQKHPTILIQMHCHDTGGFSEMAYLMGVQAGANVIDCAISPLAGGTSQPATETLVASLAEFPEYATGLDMEKLRQLADYFRGVRRKYWKFESGLLGIDAGVISHQVPGGMISNLVGQLREQGAEHKLPEVLEENARVRADLGYPPLVTPSSQIVGTQAVLNVLTGKRYATVTRETRNLAKGMYGRTTVPIAPDILKQLLGDEQPIDHRPADDLEPEMEKAKAEIADLAENIDDVLSYVMFPQVAREFFQWRREGGGPERELVAAVVGAMTISEKKQQAAAAPAPAAAHNGDTSNWRSFGRLRQMR
ncbi:pyruvate carboxylase subunit B [Tepidiforma sp.]|uniref:pyruvate carboxylase subunit B n=1 Tax=Tepidiforma sp. TaxID=2682230 RepID=UPI00261FF6E4|nr:pyruvate carboxylase subunit B [Tepidiforma sp.]MCX7618053.1 pyruvate carboxylase subunit B [Tepidiforma sp.]